MRKIFFINLTRCVFILGGIILIFSPSSWWPTYYRPIPMGVAAILYSYLISLPKIIFKKAPQSLIKKFQIALALSLIFCGLGSLGLWSSTFRGIIDYDKFVHFLFFFSMTAVGSPLLAMQNKWSIKKAVIVAVAITAFSGVAWEFIEYFFAAYFHIGFFGTLFDHDSRFDLITNLSGIMTGVLFLVLRYLFSSSSSSPASRG